jgi:hypothetical protein
MSMDAHSGARVGTRAGAGTSTSTTSTALTTDVHSDAHAPVTNIMSLPATLLAKIIEMLPLISPGAVWNKYAFPPASVSLHATTLLWPSIAHVCCVHTTADKYAVPHRLFHCSDVLVNLDCTRFAVCTPLMYAFSRAIAAI